MQIHKIFVYIVHTGLNVAHPALGLLKFFDHRQTKKVKSLTLVTSPIMDDKVNGLSTILLMLSPNLALEMIT